MGVVISRDSAYGLELAKWDTPKGQPVRDGNGDPYRGPDGQIVYGMNGVGAEYPKMLFKAQINPRTGQASVGEVQPHPMYYSQPAELEAAQLYVQSFNASCQKLVNDEQAERIAKGQGWCLTQTDALAQFEKEQQEIAAANAELAYQAQRMSEKARAEFKQAEADTDKHVVDVKPTKEAGRATVRPVTSAKD